MSSHILPSNKVSQGYINKGMHAPRQKHSKLILLKSDGSTTFRELQKSTDLTSVGSYQNSVIPYQNEDVAQQTSLHYLYQSHQWIPVGSWHQVLHSYKDV